MIGQRQTRWRRHAAAAGATAVVALAAALGPVAPWADHDRSGRALERAAADSGTLEMRANQSPGRAVPTPAPTTTTTAPPPPPPTTTTPPPPPPRYTIEPYRGLGAWLDVYDWSATFAQHNPAVEPDVVDALAAQGVQTLYIQASKWDAPELVLEAPRLLAFIDRAHQHGMSVVGWYLPTLENPSLDVQRLLAISSLPVDGLAVDIEATNVADVAERNRRVIAVSDHLRAALPGQVIGAIPLEPVLIEDINARYWPAFPWPELSRSYDVWLPMAYWTNRRGDWRDAHTYTAANIDRLRAHIGRPDAPVHALGGIGDATTVVDLQGFRAAATERGVIGGSIYDFRTTAAPFWPELVPFRELR